MHGNDNGAEVAAIHGRDATPICRRYAQRPNAGRPMVAGSALHDPRMAHPDEPSACQRQQACGGQADMEGVCESGCMCLRHERGAWEEGKLAEMGAEPQNRREPVYPEATEDVVTSRPTGPISTGNVLCLLAYQHYRCALTGRDLNPETASIDHILPIRLGGAHVIENTQILHKDVNRAKGSMTNEEFVTLCRDVASWADAHTRECPRSEGQHHE